MGKASWVGILLALGACGGNKVEDAAEAPRNVLFVITDTLRADKLGCYGGGRQLTPYLDDFAAQGLRFANASSHAPWTMPSIATMLTGLHPKEHGAGGRLGKFQKLNSSVTTLPTVFQDAGYEAHCIANVGFLADSFGVTRGFGSTDVYAPTSNVDVRDATATTDQALAWLDEDRQQPFFLLVHYFDPHAVYDPPAAFRQRFGMPRDKNNTSLKFPTRQQMMAIRDGSLDLAPELIARAEALHDGEIAYMDSQIGRLFAGLSERGLDDSTVVAVTADHGEEFLEHGGFEHGHQLYQEMTHVPLILRAPGLAHGVDERLVGHIDLAATLCQLADCAPAEQFLKFGRSLLDQGALDRGILAHGNMWGEPLTSWRLGDEKLIQRGDGSYELYDLTKDGGEQTDLAATSPDRVQELAKLLDGMQQYMDGLARGEDVELSDEMRKHLAGGGYIGGDEGEDE